MVIQYLRRLGPNRELSLKRLTLKTIMLLALTKPSCSADLSRLDIRTRAYRSDSVVFRLVYLVKESRPSHPGADFFFPNFSEDPMVCPMVTLKAFSHLNRFSPQFPKCIQQGALNVHLVISYYIHRKRFHWCQ